MAMNVVDVLLAGNLGTDVLAAVTLGTQVWVLAMLLIYGLLLSLTSMAAQLDGAGQRDAVGALFRQGLWLAVAVGIGLGLLLGQAGPVFGWFKVAPTIIPEATRFLSAIAWGTPALALVVACAKTSDGLSMTRPSMYFNLFALLLLAPLAWVLMYGKFGLPRLGAYGAGLAHAITLWLQAFAFLVFVARARRFRTAQLFERFEWPRPAMLGELMKTGTPMAVALFMEGSMFVVVALLTGALGAVTTGAHAIAINVASLTFMLPLGIAMATTVRVGNAVGRRDADGVAWAAIGGLAPVLLTQVFAVLLMVVLPGPIARLYTTDAAVIALAVTLLGYAAIFQLSDGIQTLAAGALRGLNDTAVPALITIVAYWGVGLPAAWYFAYRLQLDAVGLWIGLILGLAAAATLLTARFVASVRRLKRDGIPELLIARGPPLPDLDPDVR